MLTGVAEVNNYLQGNEGIALISEAVLNTLVRYLNIEAGAFYTYNDSERQLILLASNGLPADAQKIYFFGEGLVGSAATKESLSIVKDIPSKYLNLTGGVIKGEASQAVYIPIYLHHELKGLLELLTFKSFSEQDITLLKVI
jgi:putative methionine-R-sulfoxide reductase with GAF domain